MPLTRLTTPRVLALALGALVCSACGGTQAEPAPGTAGASVSQLRWTANLTPQSGTTVTGDVTVTPAPPNRTRVSISIQGAPPNLNLPWHVHTGICGGGGPVFGSAGSYPMLGTTGDGRGRLQVDLLVDPPTAGAHHVDVHAGPSDNRVVACGDLVQRSGTAQ